MQLLRLMPWSDRRNLLEGESFPLSCDVGMRGAVNTGLYLRLVKITEPEGYLSRYGNDACKPNDGRAAYYCLASLMARRRCVSSRPIWSVVEIKICGKHWGVCGCGCLSWTQTQISRLCLALPSRKTRLKTELQPHTLTVWVFKSQLYAEIMDFRASNKFRVKPDCCWAEAVVQKTNSHWLWFG